MLAVLGLVGGLHMETMPVWRFGAYLVLALLAYVQGRRVHSRFAWYVVGGVAVVGGAVVAVLAVHELSSVLLTFGITFVLPWLGGRYRRQEALLVAAERERVRQLEREQEHVAEQARLHERGRVAADLHDSLGHELALIALRAGALELSAELRPKHRKAAGEMRAAAVTATDRLRQVLAMLRDRDDVPPVEEIVERATAAGMTVALDGTAPDHKLVDQALRRVVRETLTNAARHAPGAPVAIAISTEHRQVTAHITNPAPEPRTTGSGLISLQERLRLLGGHLDVAYRDGTFHVTAQVPIT